MIELSERTTLVPFGTKMKFGGTFDLQELYHELERWFRHFGYSWKETKYRLYDQPSGLQQIEIKWHCTRKVDDYQKFTLDLHWQALVTEVEANIEGVKKKLKKGSMEFRTEAYITKNVPPNWKTPLGKIFWLIYERILIKKRLADYEAILFGESQRCYDEIRAFFKYYGT
ncbi:MAG: hypothetical protein ABIB71_09030 [Candidatus Woesearchaeota archaeon]